MKTTGETTKRPGNTMILIGLCTAVLGGALTIAVFGQGDIPTMFDWVLLFGGLLLAAIGFGRRVLAALESR